MADSTRSRQATCEFCGTTFETRFSRARRCPSDDCKRAYNRHRMREFNARWKDEHGERYSKRYDGREYNACYTVTCQICGNVYKSSKPNARYCAGRCTAVGVSRTMGGTGVPRSEREPDKREQIQARARKRIDKAAAGSRGNGRFTSGPCNQCGTPFTCRPGNTEARYCSPPCTKKAGRIRRDARERGAPGHTLTRKARWQIYAAHDFTCWLCELPLNMDAHYLEDDAPTIDHVVALAAGGTHEETNLRPAHRWCNSIKGDRDEW